MCKSAIEQIEETVEKTGKPITATDLTKICDTEQEKIIDELGPKFTECYDEMIENISDELLEMLLERIDVSTGKVVI
jgi:hypothetical protein